MARPSRDDHKSPHESPLVPFLLAGPPPDRTTWEGWQQWRQSRGSFIPAPRRTPAEYQARSLRARGAA